MARRLDRQAGFPAPIFEIQGAFQINWLRATALLLIVTLVMPFFSISATVVTGALLFVGVAGMILMFRSTARAITRRRRDGVVLPAALVMANDRLFGPGGGAQYGVVVYSLDEALRDDRDRLLELAQRLYELRGAKSPGSDELAALARDLDSERVHERPRAIPAEWAGAQRTWAVDVQFDRERLPAGYIDQPLFLCLVSADAPVAPAELLPLELWYRPDVLPLLHGTETPGDDS